MSWHCNAIDHGLTIFPTGKIGPCCQISSDYLKPINLFRDPDRFSDLKTEFPPAACEKCVKNELNGIPSYRKFFNSHQVTDDQKIVFLDIRNTNQCNLKCRYCGPHFSSQWAQELEFENVLIHTDLSNIMNEILTHDLRLIYFTGGEPLISGDHWKILTYLIDKGISKNIKLMYNSNLTNLKYKDTDFFKIWDEFFSVDILVSIDAVGELFNFIRSGADWHVVEENLNKIIDKGLTKVKLSISCVISILNIWNLQDFIRYFQNKKIPVNFILLHGPDYLSVDVIPDHLKSLALKSVDDALLLCDNAVLRNAQKLIINNQNQLLFKHCLSHILLLDSLRKESLFDLLPFKSIANSLITNNHEYE